MKSEGLPNFSYCTTWTRYALVGPMPPPLCPDHAGHWEVVSTNILHISPELLFIWTWKRVSNETAKAP